MSVRRLKAPAPGSGELVPAWRFLLAQDLEPPWAVLCCGLRARCGLRLLVLQLEVELFDDGAWNQKDKNVVEPKMLFNQKV